MPEVNLDQLEREAKAALLDRIKHKAVLADNDVELVSLAQAYAYTVGAKWGQVPGAGS